MCIRDRAWVPSRDLSGDREEPTPAVIYTGEETRPTPAAAVGVVIELQAGRYRFARQFPERYRRTEAGPVAPEDRAERRCAGERAPHSSKTAGGPPSGFLINRRLEPLLTCQVRPSSKSRCGDRLLSARPS